MGKSPSEVPAFDEHIKTVLQRLRSAFAELLSAVGADPTKPQETARQLGLNKSLTWKISKIIREADPAVALPHLPGKPGLRIFLDSLKRAGAPPKALAALHEATGELDRLIKLHAGDRETLGLMLGHLAGNSEGLLQQEAQRKLAFRGNSATFGVQARVQICVNFIAPSEDPDWVDLAWLSGLVDFRRLRRDAAWAIASTRKITDDGTLMPVGVLQPIDPGFAGADQAPLLGEYCSKPLPGIRIYTGSDALIRYELVEGPVGDTAAATCIIGIFGRRFVRRTCAPGDTLGEHGARLYTPAELLIHDFFVHRDLEYAMSPQIHLYNQLPSAPPYPGGGRDCGLLPLCEEVQYLGGGPPDVLAPEVPAYRSMIQSVFTRVGWNAHDFHGFRLTMRYPPIPTLALYRYELTD